MYQHVEYFGREQNILRLEVPDFNPLQPVLPDLPCRLGGGVSGESGVDSELNLSFPLW